MGRDLGRGDPSRSAGPAPAASSRWRPGPAAVHGGANARPFVPRLNAYSMELSSDRAGAVPEASDRGGSIRSRDRPIFRNEGVDATHNPEFTIWGVRGYGYYDTVATLNRELIP